MCRIYVPCFLLQFHVPAYNFFSLPHLLLEDLGQLAGNGITDLSGLCLATNVASLDALLDDDSDCLVDGLGEFGLLEGVLEHHADGKKHGNGVDDALAGDVGCGTCEGELVEV